MYYDSEKAEKYPVDCFQKFLHRAVNVKLRSDSFDRQFLVRLGLCSGIKKKKKGGPTRSVGFLVGFCNCLPDFE